MKTLESIVPDLERCRALKEAGFPQDGPLVWARYDGGIPQIRVREFGNPARWRTVCAAPTLSEILGELPGFVVRHNTIYHLAQYRFTDEDEQAALDVILAEPLAKIGYPVDHSPDPPRSPVEEYEGDHGSLGTSLHAYCYQRASDNGIAFRHPVARPRAVDAAADLYLALHAAGLLSPEAPSPEAPAPASGVPSVEPT